MAWQRIMTMFLSVYTSLISFRRFFKNGGFACSGPSSYHRPRVYSNARQCMKSTTLGDVQVKEGEFVLVDTFSIHYDHNLWGEDADKFCPERWLKPSERPLAAFLSFGIGPRQCIGMRLALMEEKLVLAHLLKRFDIAATKDTDETFILKGTTTISPEKVIVLLKRRNTTC